MKIKLTAPEGYKYKDTRTGSEHSEVVVDSKKQSRFVLVPATDNNPINV